MCTGAVIWARNQAAIKTYEGTFVTIGMVRQRPTAIEIWQRWDAWEKLYTRRSYSRYSSAVPPSVLDFEGADYILAPEKRPYFGAWLPDLVLYPEDSGWYWWSSFVVEFSPLEDCLPDSPVEVRVEKLVSERRREMEPGMLLEPGDVIFLCDHNNADPQPLYAGRKYLAFLSLRGVHDPTSAAAHMEWAPLFNVVLSAQARPDGSLIGDNIVLPTIREVTVGFYETEEGRFWLQYAGALWNGYSTVPVLSTNGTHLLLPFYNGTAYIAQGEDIAPEEYENGERVCLVSENFARMNGISLGGTLRLPLYCANYESAPNDGFDEPTYGEGNGGIFGWDIGPPLNAEGEPYPVFSDHEYVVRGIYSCESGNDAACAMGANTIVIPANSVQESDENNILVHGPMRYTTTTFQIPNGSIEAFMEQWLLQGNDNLEFEFQDRGYTQLHRGLENMKRISMLFLAIGAAMSLSLAFFFCHVFISKNKTRTAIERLLGYTKKQCAVSLLSGFLLAAALSIAAGCAVGIVVEEYIAGSVMGQEYFDTRYTIGPLGQEDIVIEDVSASASYAPAAGLALFIVVCLISVVFLLSNVREEPLVLLGGRCEY